MEVQNTHWSPKSFLKLEPVTLPWIHCVLPKRWVMKRITWCCLEGRFVNRGFRWWTSRKLPAVRITAHLAKLGEHLWAHITVLIQARVISHEFVFKREFFTRINSENHVDVFQVFVDEYQFGLICVATGPCSMARYTTPVGRRSRFWNS
jgi:hypothetical protein